MLRNRNHDHAIVTAIALAAIAATACSSDKEHKGGLSVDMLPTAEASMVNATKNPGNTARVDSSLITNADSAAPGEITYAAAEAAYNARKYSQARDMFEDLVSRNPSNGWGYYMLALSAWKSGDRVSAEAAFNETLARDPKHLKSHLNLARVMLEDGRPREALVHAEKVVQIDSTSLDGYRLLGQIHGELKNLDLALLSYERAIHIHQKDAWSMNNLAYLLIQNGRYDEALGPLALATSIEPRNATLQNNLGLALELTGRFTQATSAYKTALGFESGYEKASAALQRIAAKSDDPGVMPADLKAIAESYAEKIKG